jgi:hypothetical protein
LPAPVMVAKPVITTVTNSQPIAAKVARFTGGGSCALAGIGCLQSITDYAAISY